MKTKNLTCAIAGAGMLLAAAPVFATTIDNINFPTSSGHHFFAGTVNENTVTTPGQVLTGSGQITSIDNNLNFCGTGNSCTLTYKFGGYKLEKISANSASFSGGFVNFYANGSTTAFLTTTADPEENSQYTLNGNLTNGGTDQAQNTAVGLLSVTGGDAASIFNNNSYKNGLGGLSDLLFNTSLSPSGQMMFTGSADAHYISNVPEPSELGVLGLGLALIAVGVGYRRRQDV